MSRYDKKQGLDGIATLTNDPLALINIHKLKVGDRVEHCEKDNSGTVQEVDDDEYGCVVIFDDGEETWIECDQLTKQ